MFMNSLRNSLLELVIVILERCKKEGCNLVTQDDQKKGGDKGDVKIFLF